MLEYFTNKKKNKEAKKAKEEEVSKAQAEPPAQQHNGASHETATQPTEPRHDLALEPQASSSSSSAPGPGKPVLTRDDESFLQSILAEDGPAPPLPARVNVPDLDWPSDDASSAHRSTTPDEGAKGKETAESKDAKDVKSEDGKKPNRFSAVFSKIGKKKKHGDTLKPEDAQAEGVTEEEKEANDMNRVLDRLNLSAANNKVIPLSEESSEVLRKFTQIFKDLANGVPTAYDDLVNLIKDRDGAITKGFEKLPSGLQKLVMQLPDKVTGSIAPEVIAAAAKSQGLEAAENIMLSPQKLFELLTKPGALVSMLRAIVATLQQRWPAFIGVNVIWSVALACKYFTSSNRSCHVY